MCPRTLMMLRSYHGRVVPATTHRVAEVRSNQKDDTLAHGNSRLVKAVEALRRGKIIALPTDTLYGLAAGVRSESGVRALYATKRRSEDVPLAICVGDAQEVGNYLETGHLASGLLEELLPGPVTVISWTKSSSDLPNCINPGRRLLGVRVPNSCFVRVLSILLLSLLRLVFYTFLFCLYDI
mmetsp:Transcript_11688/g.48999  ORF Transcript_11688/g.48999 Transcript_11688/m.48999 type:complete len:182 (-) Transcript_11688:1731-2276(-)